MNNNDPANDSINNQRQIRFIAFYLPQFHPIHENNEWWGKGFTEWTNVTKAKPLYRGHIQPKLPTDLGFYDLRVPETREAQAELAYANGIEGFCYWHYWFSGKRILERPFNEVLRSGSPNFPFCLAWANESWSGVWHGNPNKILIQQCYPGKQDYREHANTLLDVFSDKRYIRIDGKPLFIIYKPLNIPNLLELVEIFQETAINNGIGELYICGFTDSKEINPQQYNLDGIIYSGFNQIFSKKNRLKKILFSKIKNELLSTLLGYPKRIYPYHLVYKTWLDYPSFHYDYYPVVFPNWDNSPRSGKNGIIISESTPKLFKKHLNIAINKISQRKTDKKIIFIKSWNEWAEGNYLEPDLINGNGLLKTIKEVATL